MPARNPRPRGQSLLEVVGASTIIAIALVPALRMMRDSLQVSRDLEEANLMATLCVDKLEEHLALASANWDMSTSSGDFASLENRSYLKYRVTKSDATADGGIADRLMSIVGVVWNDADGDNTVDSGEKQVTFATKVSKVFTYNDAN